jgi:hypothetical protein
MLGRLLAGVVAVGVMAGAAQPAVAIGNDWSSVAAGKAQTAVAVGDKLQSRMGISGVGSGVLGAEWKPYDGDHVRFEINATATDPMHPSGTFHVVHSKADATLVADFRGRIASLTTVDEVGVATGVIDDADHPGVPLEMLGKAVSFTVYDGGRQDRIGWMWGFFGAPLAPLQGPAPTFPLSTSTFHITSTTTDSPSAPGPAPAPAGAASAPAGAASTAAGAASGASSSASRARAPQPVGAVRTTTSTVARTSSATGGMTAPGVGLTTTASGGTTVAVVLGGPRGSGGTADSHGSGAPGGAGRAPMRVEVVGRVQAGADPTKVVGSFRFSADGSVVEGRLTCLVAGGPVAVTTGVVTGSSDPSRIGRPVAFSLKDGRTDRVGWVWSWSDGTPPVADCRSTVPFFKGAWGGVVVHQ